MNLECFDLIRDNNDDDYDDDDRNGAKKLDMKMTVL